MNTSLDVIDYNKKEKTSFLLFCVPPPYLLGQASIINVIDCKVSVNHFLNPRKNKKRINFYSLLHVLKIASILFDKEFRKQE
jgi:hypothetical protein